MPPGFMSKELVAGQKLQTYEIISVLGEGGMSRVYLCEDMVLGRRVALKQLLTESNDRRSIIRLQQEGQSLARLSHPNIVKILAFFNSDDGDPFLVMELLHGCSLAELLSKNGSLSLGEVVKLAEQLCDALQHAHDAGIVHRDIKPTNIFLCNRKIESAKIIDFGIAKIADNSVNATKTGEFVGSPAYLSPEQAMQKPITERSDQYSLGCVLYECLTGHPPFEDKTAMGLILKHINEEVVPLGKHSFVPPAVAKAIERSLKKNPELRFDSITEFKNAVSGKAIATNENQPLMLTALAIGVLVFVGLCVGTWSMLTSEPAQKMPLPTVNGKPDSISQNTAKVTDDLHALPRLDNTFLTLEKSNENAAKNEHFIEQRLQSNPMIDYLSLETYAITNRALVTLSHAKNLKTLLMSETDIGDDASAHLSKIRTLETLFVAKTNVGDAFVEKISVLPNLAELSLSYTSVTPLGLKPLTHTTSLKRLSVRGCSKIDDSTADVFAQIPGLQELDVGKTAVGDEFLRKLSQKPNLKLTNISLAGTQVTQKCIASLAKIKSLTGLFLDDEHNGILDVAGLQHLPLTMISLRTCPITASSPIVQQLSKFPKLRTLRLDRTAIQDSDLLTLAKMPKLKTLEITSCDLLTPDGISAFKKSKPECKVIHEAVERNSKYAKAESAFRNLNEDIK